MEWGEKKPSSGGCLVGTKYWGTHKNVLRISLYNLIQTEILKETGMFFAQSQGRRARGLASPREQEERRSWQCCGAQLLAGAVTCFTCLGQKSQGCQAVLSPTEMELAPAIPQESAEGKNPVSATDCNCKGMEKGFLDLMLVMMHHLCRFLQDDFNCNLKEKHKQFKNNNNNKKSEFLKSWVNKSFLYEADVQTRAKLSLAPCQNLDLS